MTWIAHYSDGTSLGAYYLSNGTQIWFRASFPLESSGGALSQIAQYDNKIYFGSHSGLLHAVNQSNGVSICDIYINPNGNGGLGFDMYQGPSIANNGIGFVGNLHGDFLMFNASNCARLWTTTLWSPQANYPFQSAIYNDPAISKGKVYFKSDNQNIYALDLGNGTEEWTDLGHDGTLTGKSNCPNCLTTKKGHSKVIPLQAGPTGLI